MRVTTSVQFMLTRILLSLMLIHSPDEHYNLHPIYYHGLLYL